MRDGFNFRIPMFTDKGTFIEYQYLQLGDDVYITLCGYNGEPEQCTGLKDKNGKLIYENDIVKRNDDLLVVRYQEEMSCLAPQYFYLENDKIVYCGREWFEEYNNEDCKLYTSNFYEVIGNVYENKSLLIRGCK